MVNYGNNQTYTLTASTGYHITDCVVDGVDLGAVTSYTFSSVSANHTIVAIASVYIVSSAGTGGTISPLGSTSVVTTNNQSYTITPSTGYSIGPVYVDGTSVGAVSTYTFSAVSVAHTISATFVPNTYTLSPTFYFQSPLEPSNPLRNIETV